MYLDVDDLPQLMSQFGAPAVDAMLKKVAVAAGQSLSQMDAVCRLGARLAVMMPGTNLEGAGRAAEEIRASLAATPLKIDESEVSVTLSIGATEVLSGDTPSSLSQRADAAQAAAKAAGKNCVYVHDGACCGLFAADGAVGNSRALPV